MARVSDRHRVKAHRICRIVAEGMLVDLSRHTRNGGRLELVMPGPTTEDKVAEALAQIDEEDPDPADGGDVQE